MSTFCEGRLELTFDSPPWDARKWDDEPAYRLGIQRLEETKAVDFVALREDLLLYLELKDFRRHRIENKLRLRDGDLAKEVALKVRDTIAGIVGARRARQDGDEWAPFARAAAAKKPSLHVVLWLEEDMPPRGPQGAHDRARITFEAELKRQLRWLTTKVFVAALDRCEHLADISVRNLPDEA